MHELSLAEEIGDIVERAAITLPRISSVTLRVGTLAGVEVDALLFCLESVFKGTKAEGALVDIDTVAARATCRHCGHEQPVGARYDPCTQCGATGMALRCGDELTVLRIAGPSPTGG